MNVSTKFSYGYGFNMEFAICIHFERRGPERGRSPSIRDFCGATRSPDRFHAFESFNEKARVYALSAASNIALLGVAARFIVSYELSSLHGF